jgi:general secretion pathway protein K
MMAIFATSLMIFLAVEVSYDTSVEYLVASQQVNRLKAYYAAKAGVEMSLLRILIYKKAMAQFWRSTQRQRIDARSYLADAIRLASDIS